MHPVLGSGAGTGEIRLLTARASCVRFLQNGEKTVGKMSLVLSNLAAEGIGQGVFFLLTLPAKHLLGGRCCLNRRSLLATDLQFVLA